MPRKSNDPLVWGREKGGEPSAKASGPGERLGDRAPPVKERRSERTQLRDHRRGEHAGPRRRDEYARAEEVTGGGAAAPARELGPGVTIEGHLIAQRSAHLGRGPGEHRPERQGEHQGAATKQPSHNQVGGGHGAGMTTDEAKKASKRERHGLGVTAVVADGA